MKMLAYLATIEPGDNFPDIGFMWDRHIGPMPGFELTELWMTEAGVPTKGIWYGTYYSGEGMFKNGCKPTIKTRKALLQKVLINEEEHVEEDSDLLVRNNPNAVSGRRNALLPGEQCMLNNLGVWFGYLSYDEAKFKEFQNNKKAAPPPKKPVVSKK